MTVSNVDNYKRVIQCVKCDLAPALGCTEPISTILAVVRAREALGNITPDRVELFVSGNMYKNGKGVGIPNTSMKGLHIAAGLGMFTGKSEDKLQILKDLQDIHVVAAKNAIDAKLINIKIKQDVDNLYVEAHVFKGKESACAVVEKKHTFFKQVMLNGKIIEENIYCEPFQTQSDGSYEGITVAQIYECAKKAPLSEIDFVMESAKLNKVVSDEGLRGEYGLKVGKRILASINNGSLNDDIMLRAMAKAAAGSDARMGGCGLPVITNSGSGNQGITITMPVLEMAEETKADLETLTRALFIAHAIPIHIKKRIGPLSALCGIIAASIGAGVGMMYLQGAKLNQINQLIQYMLADLSGMICDGAKPSCALKIATCIGAAVRSMLFAFDEEIIPFDDGILNYDVEESIVNFAHLGTSGMNNVDTMLLSVMDESCCD